MPKAKAKVAAKEAPAGPIFDEPPRKLTTLKSMTDDVDLPEEIEFQREAETKDLEKEVEEVKVLAQELDSTVEKDSALSKLAKTMMSRFERLEQQLHVVSAQALTKNRRALPNSPVEDISDETPVSVLVRSTGHFRWGSKTYNLDRAGAVIELPRCFVNRLKKNNVVQDLV